MIGYETTGTGPRGIVVLNDWLSDTSTWDGARAYLDGGSATWAFADLRGYGRSKGEPGEHTVEEAAGDVLELADARGWRRFSVVGHSMSTLVALHLAQQRPGRVDRAVVLTPPPPESLGYDDATFAAVRAVALGDDAKRTTALRMILGERLSAGFLRAKAERWRARAAPEAAADYVAMFGRRGLPDRTTRIARPVLAVTGEEDAPVMRHAAVLGFLSPLCEHLQVVAIAGCGHYPMQETPPWLVTVVERFLFAGDETGGACEP
jgi:pimeloyl-ACP methyl ester carboxylesterase